MNCIIERTKNFFELSLKMGKYKKHVLGYAKI